MPDASRLGLAPDGKPLGLAPDGKPLRRPDRPPDGSCPGSPWLESFDVFDWEAYTAKAPAPRAAAPETPRPAHSSTMRREGPAGVGGSFPLGFSFSGSGGLLDAGLGCCSSVTRPWDTRQLWGHCDWPVRQMGFPLSRDDSRRWSGTVRELYAERAGHPRRDPVEDA